MPTPQCKGARHPSPPLQHSVQHAVQGVSQRSGPCSPASQAQGNIPDAAAGAAHCAARELDRRDDQFSIPKPCGASRWHVRDMICLGPVGAECKV